MTEYEDRQLEAFRSGRMTQEQERDFIAYWLKRFADHEEEVRQARYGPDRDPEASK